MNENLSKLVKYTFPSNKEWTGIWSADNRRRHLPFPSMDMLNIDLAKKINVNYAGFMQPVRMTYKCAASDEYILSVRKEP